MGSDSSSSSRAEWVDLENDRCRHDEYQIKVKRVAIRSCQFMNGFAQASAMAGKWTVNIFTFGISSAVNGGIKNPTHDYVQLNTVCDICGENKFITVEFNNNCSGSKFFSYG